MGRDGTTLACFRVRLHSSRAWRRSSSVRGLVERAPLSAMDQQISSPGQMSRRVRRHAPRNKLALRATGEMGSNACGTSDLWRRSRRNGQRAPKHTPLDLRIYLFSCVTVHMYVSHVLTA